MVDTGGDERTAHETETLIKTPMKLTGTTDKSGSGDVIGPVLSYGFNQFRNIIRIMGTIRIDENGNFILNKGNGCPNGISFSLSMIKYDVDTHRTDNGSGVVSGTPIYHHDTVGMILAGVYYVTNGLFFIEGSYDHR